MNTHKTFLLYNESKFWNLNLKQKFIAEVLIPNPAFEPMGQELLRIQST